MTAGKRRLVGAYRVAINEPAPSKWFLLIRKQQSAIERLLERLSRLRTPLATGRVQSDVNSVVNRFETQRSPLMENTMTRDLMRDSSATTPDHDKLHEDISSLKENYAGLKDDFNRLVGNAVSIGKQTPGLAAEQSRYAVDSAKDGAERVKEMGKDNWERAVQKVRDNPETAALIAFGIGFIAAKLLRGDRHH